MQLETFITDKRTRAEVQSEARQALKDNGGSGQLIIATGVGKTKIAIDEMFDLIASGIEPEQILLGNHYVKLLEVAWRDEWIKWGGSEEIYDRLTKSTYVSFPKIKDRRFELVVMDEAHHLTENSLSFFEQNDFNRVIMLTATRPPKGDIKRELLDCLAPVVFKYSIHDAVNDSNVSPFDICLVPVILDPKDRYIKAGNKNKLFYQTEVDKYTYLNKIYNGAVNRKKSIQGEIDVARAKGEYIGDLVSDATKQAKLIEIARFQRLHFIYGLKSKTKAAKIIMDRFFKEEERNVVFCGSIDQANELCGDKVFHSKSKGTAYNEFKESTSNLLGVVNALNEGHNLPNLDNSLVVQINSKELAIIQRIGRSIRFRPNYRAQIIVLYAQGTQDEVWVKKALENFDQSIIKKFAGVESFLRKNLS